MTAADIAERLNLGHIAERADRAKISIQHTGSAYVELTPDDGTIYKIAIVRKSGIDGRLMFASSFGALYPWGGGRMHVDYVQSHYVTDGRLWTAVVFTEFLNALSERLAAP